MIILTSIITWQNDPIYFDPEPVPTRLWLNANDLMKANRTIEFLSQDNTLHLFPIMVRRSDFVRKKQSDRILARFPYIELSTEDKELVAKQDLLIAERLRDYFYKSDNRKVLEWRAILRKDLERGFVPLPFLCCFPNEIKIDFATRTFESARGEAFKMPTQLTEELAYLSGMVNGDGSLTKYVASIVDFSLENIRQLKNLFERLFHQTGRIQLQTENSPTLIITNLWVVRLFSFLTSQPIGGKKYDALQEPLVFKKESFRKHYWSGVMDADGSYINGNVKLISASKSFIEDFILYLKSLKINSKCYDRGDGTFQAYIPSKYHQTYKINMLCLHPEKRIDFVRLKKGREKINSSPKYSFGFDESKMTNGYFDFSLMKDVQVVGLGEYIKDLRGKTQQQTLAKKLGVSPQYLSQLEKNKTSISIDFLGKLLLFNKIDSLMPFLFRNGKSIKFRRKSAKPVYLNFKPSLDLKYFSQKMIFYPSVIRIIDADELVIEKIEKNFDIEIKKNTITNGTIRYFLSTYLILKNKT